MNKSTIILASTSPRRKELLSQLGIDCRVWAAELDESPRQGETAAELVCRLALAKAMAVAERLPAKEHALPVLGADTLVELDGQILGKPLDRQDAMRMLNLLSGREHRVLSAVALVDGQRREVRLNTSLVCFRELSADEIGAYWQCGEPLGKAGGYAVQGRAGVWIRELRGSYSGVMGLPLFETAELLELAGVRIF